MPKEDPMNEKRRSILAAAGVMLLAGANSVWGQNRVKIGVIGSGRVGGTIGGLWVKAGYDVMFSARDIGEVKELVAGLGPKAHAGTPREAAAFGDVVLISVPYAALPQIGRDNAAELKGKVVLDTCNPIAGRDGDMAVAARAKGTGVASAELLPGVRLVRAFNCVGYTSMRSEAHRAGGRRPGRAQDRDTTRPGCGLRAGGRRRPRACEGIRCRHAGVRQGADCRRIAQDTGDQLTG
jgi:predicted dinucleotide-binding enzyme